MHLFLAVLSFFSDFKPTKFSHISTNANLLPIHVVTKGDLMRNQAPDALPCLRTHYEKHGYAHGR